MITHLSVDWQKIKLTEPLQNEEYDNLKQSAYIQRSCTTPLIGQRRVDGNASAGRRCRRVPAERTQRHIKESLGLPRSASRLG